MLLSLLCVCFFPKMFWVLQLSYLRAGPSTVRVQLDCSENTGCVN